MSARVAAGLAGVVATVLALVPIPLGYALAQGAVTNECIFDGGAPDCYGGGERLFLLLWGGACFAATAAIAYAGAGGVVWALRQRLLPHLGKALVAAPILAFLTVLAPFAG